LLGALVAGQLENAAGRVALALGRRNARAREVDVNSFIPPDSRLARQAEIACEEQPASIAAHSYRTWIYGAALAAIDRVELDRELFYCATLVHDHAIATPVAGRDFTLGGAERALACAAAAGLQGEDAEKIADAICIHTTPGVTVDRDGALGCYVQWGAMVDGAGLRLWDVSEANVDAVLRDHPRGAGFKSELTALRAEARAVPDGRFALLARCGLLLAVRLAPFEN
jgi:hypothetical protein